MKAIQLNYSDINGGAARAAYRIHHALRESGVDSRLWVNQTAAGDWTVGGPRNMLEKAMGLLRPPIGRLFTQALKTSNPILHSPQVLPSLWVKQINSSDADVVHLHWVQGEMLSIANIARIRKPIVWTLHDMWAFCGAEHYTEESRWREGYRKGNRPSYESSFDLNRWTWERKRKHWQRPMHIVTPSRWLADCVRQSALMRDWPVSVIPNPLDTERWKPLPKELARELLGLPTDVPLLLFGAMGGGRDPRKGLDLLLEALAQLCDAPEAQGLELVVFGQRAPQQPPKLGFPINYIGHLHDDLSLRALYSAADMLVLPSRQDNLPNTGVESLACGTPVVAFDTCGLPDIVTHQETGYLARAFDAKDLAYGIKWVIADRTRHAQLCSNARLSAVARFSHSVIAPQYKELYQAAVVTKYA